MNLGTTKSANSFATGRFAVTGTAALTPQAREVTPQASLLTDQDRATMCSLAATLIAAGNVKAGARIAEFTHKFWPNDAQALMVLAHVHLAQNDHLAVVALLAPALLSGKVAKPKLWMILGVSFLKTMQPAKAFDAARRYLLTKGS